MLCICSFLWSSIIIVYWTLNFSLQTHTKAQNSTATALLCFQKAFLSSLPFPFPSAPPSQHKLNTHLTWGCPRTTRTSRLEKKRTPCHRQRPGEPGATCSARLRAARAGAARPDADGDAAEPGALSRQPFPGQAGRGPHGPQLRSRPQNRSCPGVL